MIGFLGRLTLTVIVTAMLVFGGLLVVANNSSDACRRDTYSHPYKHLRQENGGWNHAYPHHTS
jgi:hypothetical protein